ncbi:hypothetical protein CDIK_2898 [Cucumispora dikerogammari]|nr:hypothetical protein CDIK_2898 [Cucumispora dikerogammari]
MPLFGVLVVYAEYTRISFFELTRVRNKATLHNIVNKHVDKRSDIITDKWKAYNGPNKVFSTHKTICHRKHFVCPKNTLIHTQTIESTWSVLKRYVKNYGTNIRKNLDSLILKFKYKKTEKNVFSEFSHTISN